MHRLILAICAFTSFCVISRAEDPCSDRTPLVVEHYDSILVVHERVESDRGCWHIHRVYFCRNGRIIADRHIADEMVWHVEGSQFAIAWPDYGCHRRIYTPHICEFDTNENIEGDQNQIQWWNGARRMTSLAEPPSE